MSLLGAGFWRVAGVCVFVFSLASGARAAEIRWETPAECDPRERVNTQVEKLLDRPLSSVEGVNFDARVERLLSDGWQLTFAGIESERAERRTRTISGETCEALADAGAVAIAMAIRSNEYVADESASATPPSPEAASAPGTSFEAPSPTAPEPDRPREEAPRNDRDPGRLHPVIGAHAALDTGALPGVAPGLGVSLGVAWKSVRGEATFLAFLPRTQETAAGGGGEFALVTGALAACLQPAEAAVRPLACAGVELGQVTGEGVGISRSRSGSATWLAAKIEGGVSLRVAKGLSLLARAGVARPFSRPDFVLGGDEFVFRSAAITVRGAIGVEYSW